MRRASTNSGDAPPPPAPFSPVAVGCLLVIGVRLKNPVAEAAVPLHQFEFFVGEPSRLQQNRVGDADLADVVQLSGVFQQVGGVADDAELLADQAGVTADAHDVKARIVVAILGRAGQHQADLAVGLLQLPRPLADRRFESWL